MTTREAILTARYHDAQARRDPQAMTEALRALAPIYLAKLRPQAIVLTAPKGR